MKRVAKRNLLRHVLTGNGQKYIREYELVKPHCT